MIQANRILGNFGIIAEHWFRTLLWIGCALLMLGLFVKVTWELHEDPVLDGLDKQILILLSHYSTGLLNVWAVDMTALGSPTALTIAVIMGLIVLALK